VNLLILHPQDLVSPTEARLHGRRVEHVRMVHRAKVGQHLRVGALNGKLGEGEILRLDDEALELRINLHREPPPKLPLTLVVALPRPKVVNRVVASAASLGVARLVFINAWKVEKGYWASPKLAPENLREQLLLGLEQACDTVLPELHLARLFKPCVTSQFPEWMEGARGLVAHPGAESPCPRGLEQPVLLALGPEGGWIDAELKSLESAGLSPVGLGPRILRTETALAAIVGRLF
jgi:16S rRNA (uracil1498-N3)-methyltransferase